MKLTNYGEPTEFIALYEIIRDGFSHFGGFGIYVDKKDMIKYILKNSNGRFNLAIIENTLKYFETEG